eukprot:TRINITY_DN18443_c4_g1_i2.p1 TRINITY_DN18443_c4_g1~~TRINITY_DN18443_c4_g1_i2.p1  ORF type:complete len:252 (+),score=50.08 TRINITY_DN18443_c4_g1_i2:97-756(+)
MRRAVAAGLGGRARATALARSQAPLHSRSRPLYSEGVAEPTQLRLETPQQLRSEPSAAWRWGLRALAVAGYVLCISAAVHMQELAYMLSFLELAFPRSWAGHRACFELLSPETKSRLCREYRQAQLAGCSESLFEWMQSSYPELMAGCELSVEETLRRLRLVDDAAMRAGQAVLENWAVLLRNGAVSGKPQDVRIAKALHRAPDMLGLSAEEVAAIYGR